MARIKIWEPKYSTKSVLIDKRKVGVSNEIVFTKAPHLAGMTFTMSGYKMATYPLKSNGKIICYDVPMDAFVIKESN